MYSAYIKETMPSSEKYFVVAGSTDDKAIADDDQELERKRKRTVWQICFHYIFNFADMSSIHGFKHLTSPKRHWIEYALWSSVICMGLSGTGYLASLSWRRYFNDPTVIAIERDAQNWITNLPAGFFCPASRHNETKLHDYLMSRNMSDELRERTKTFLITLANVTYHNLKDDKVDLEPLSDDLVNIRPDDYAKTLFQISFELTRKFSINSSQWENDYNSTVLERGFCYAFNTELGPFNWPKFFLTLNGVPKGKPKIVSGIPTGGHLQSGVKDLNDEVLVVFMASNDVPDVASKNSITNKGGFSFFEFLAQTTHCAPEVQTLSVRQRRCRFSYESDLEISEKYSYNWCRMNCRWKLARKLCGCVPHFYRKTDARFCDRKGLECLKENAERLIELRDIESGKKEDCKCYPTCEDTVYLVDDMQGIQWYNSTNIEWSIKKFPKIRYKRELIFGSSDLLISIGGLAGLFLGCSVLSIVEVLYFFTIRLVLQVIKRRKSAKAFLS